MVECDFCGEEINLHFKCKYCDRVHCVKHHLSGSHNCAMLKETQRDIVHLGTVTLGMEKREEQINKESLLRIRGIVGKELFARMQKYGAIASWKLWIRGYVKSRLLKLELNSLGRKYGVERKGDRDEHLLLKIEAYERLRDKGSENR